MSFLLVFCCFHVFFLALYLAVSGSLPVLSFFFGEKKKREQVETHSKAKPLYVSRVYPYSFA